MLKVMILGCIDGGAQLLRIVLNNSVKSNHPVVIPNDALVLILHRGHMDKATTLEILGKPRIVGIQCLPTIAESVP